MNPHDPFGRNTRPAPPLPAFRPAVVPDPLALARADDAVRALGAAPPSADRRRYYAQTADGRQVTTRSNKPIEAIIEALERKAEAPVTAPVAERSRSPATVVRAPVARYASPSSRHLAALMPDDPRSNNPMAVSDQEAHEGSDWPSNGPAAGSAFELRSQDVGPWHGAAFSHGQILPGNPAPAGHAVHRYVPLGPRIKDRAETYLRWVHQKKTSRSAVIETAWTLRIFVELVGNKSLNAIDVEDVDVFLQAVSIWPSHATKRREFRTMLAPDVVTKARILRTPRLNLRTQQKHIDRLRAFFRWLEGRQEIVPGLLRGLRLYKRNHDFGLRREPFSESELGLIFDYHRTAPFETPFMFWAPLLGFYQGLRVNEIGQLYVEDVQKVMNDQWCLSITRDRPGQRLKNAQSRRLLPIHPALLKCGFLEFVQQARDWQRTTLFPGLVWGVNGPGDGIGDWFNRTLLRKRCGITNPSRTFHSFRHCFATYGDQSRVPDARLAILLGHSTGKSILRTHYVHLATPGDLARDLNDIQFPKIEHPQYVPANFAKAFEKADREDIRPMRLDAVYGAQRGVNGRAMLH